MCVERRRLEKQMKVLESQIKKLPEGKLVCAWNEDRWKWYISDGQKSVYLKKKEKLLAEKLAKKKYLTTLWEDLKQEIIAIDYYLRHHKQSKAEEMLINESEYKNLLSPSFKSFSEEMKDWINSKYESCNKYPEKRKFKTCSGNMVRSKSEVLIDMVLYTYKIAFRYECELILNDLIIYPDFTLKHPKTGKIYYWEHFGRMDDEKYAQKACAKLKSYIENGIIPNIDLIVTFETKEHPLDYEAVEKVVKEYFCE